MNDLATAGRNRTIRIFASILLLSIYIIVTYHVVADRLDTGKLIQQIVRFSLTVLLMYFVLKGKKWAVIVFTVLLAMGIAIALFALLGPPSAAKFPLLVMIFIYSVAIYHLNFSKSFKEYLYQVNH